MLNGLSIKKLAGMRTRHYIPPLQLTFGKPDHLLCADAPPLIVEFGKDVLSHDFTLY